jgi:hypothetical protein
MANRTKTTIKDSARAYEGWLRLQLGDEVVDRDLKRKHAIMSEGPFPFLRATYWRWAETILEVCPELADAPRVLAVGDIHLENFGTWRDAEGRLVWGVNDFDDAAEMPYALDLVRLAVSARVGCPRGGRGTEFCAHVLKGYTRGLADPRPIVLDHQFAWLRQQVVVPERDREEFWDKMNALSPSKKDPPRRYVDLLTDAMPDPKIKVKIRPRTAGAGSLGRPRWVAIGEWRGAPVVREAKAMVPSGWTRLAGRGAQATRCSEIATGQYRAPDPWYQLTDEVLVRRLSPNNRKIEAAEYSSELFSKKMLRAMGRDLAAIHVGRFDRSAAIERDLEARKPSWLESAVERAEEFVRREQKEWKKG